MNSDHQERSTATRARELDTMSHIPAWADPQEVANALTAISSYSAYFAVAVTEQPEGPLLTDYYDDTGTLARAIDGIADAMSTSESRVAASTLQLGLAARLWSVTLGSVLTHDVLPDLDRLRYRTDERGKISGLLTEAPAGWPAPADEADTVAALRDTVEKHLRRLHHGITSITRVADGLLWGNAASALNSAAMIAQRNSGADPSPLVQALYETEPLAGTMTRTEHGMQRRSCCLFYRTPKGSTCGDCPITNATVITGTANTTS